MKTILLALLVSFMPITAIAQNSQCIDYEVYKAFIENKFNMKLYSWAVDNEGKETIWLFLNSLRHFAFITVDLRGCSTLHMPEDQLEFFKREKPPSFDINRNMPMSRGSEM